MTLNTRFPVINDDIILKRRATLTVFHFDSPYSNFLYDEQRVLVFYRMTGTI